MGRKNTAFLELFMEHFILNKFLIMILVCLIHLSFLDVMKKLNINVHIHVH
jgi:hypothetical protein